MNEARIRLDEICDITDRWEVIVSKAKTHAEIIEGMLLILRDRLKANAQIVENPRGFCPDCNADLGTFYSNRIRWR